MEHIFQQKHDFVNHSHNIHTYKELFNYEFGYLKGMLRYCNINLEDREVRQIMSNLGIEKVIQSFKDAHPNSFTDDQGCYKEYKRLRELYVTENLQNQFEITRSKISIVKSGLSLLGKHELSTEDCIKIIKLVHLAEIKPIAEINLEEMLKILFKK